MGAYWALTWRVLVLVGVVGFIVWAVVQGSHESKQWAMWCESRGGHVIEKDHAVTVVGGNGKVGVGTDTTWYCLTDDGRILGVR